MNSPEGEYVEFNTHIATLSSHGHVDEWLCHVEHSMKEAIRSKLEKNFRDGT